MPAVPGKAHFVTAITVHAPRRPYVGFVDRNRSLRFSRSTFLRNALEPRHAGLPFAWPAVAGPARLPLEDMAHDADWISLAAAAWACAIRRMRSTRSAGRKVSLTSTDCTPQFSRSRAGA